MHCSPRQQRSLTDMMIVHFGDSLLSVSPFPRAATSLHRHTPPPPPPLQRIYLRTSSTEMNRYASAVR
eukprot:7387018-Prymnesium_polylepis.1